MKDIYLTLYIEINDSDFLFFVTRNDEQNNFEIIYKLTTPLKGIEKNSITDFHTTQGYSLNGLRYLH